MLSDFAEFGVPVVLLSGGEPLTRIDILDLAVYARSLGLRVTLSTNGTLITPYIAKRIAEIGVGYVGISLDGMEATHDSFRGQAGAFEAAMEGLRSCRAAGVKTGLRLTLTRHTVRDLDGLFEIVDREGIERVCFYHLVPSGRGRFLQDDMLTPRETRAVVETIIQRSDDYVRHGVPIEILTVDNHTDAAYLYLWALREKGPEVAERIRAVARRSGGNRSGIAIAHVDFRGQVHPDQFWWQAALGNVRLKPFSTIWSDPSNQLLLDLRDRKGLLKGRCHDCRFLDICNGNFRARAAAQTGDHWAPDPACYLSDEEIAENLAVAGHAS
jgi:radical SAM protein with 4Fe4S-binding SPASM domain